MAFRELHKLTMRSDKSTLTGKTKKVGHVAHGVGADHSPNAELPGCVAMQRLSELLQPSGSVSSFSSNLIEPKEDDEDNLGALPCRALCVCVRVTWSYK